MCGADSAAGFGSFASSLRRAARGIHTIFIPISRWAAIVRCIRGVRCMCATTTAARVFGIPVREEGTLRKATITNGEITMFRIRMAIGVFIASTCLLELGGHVMAADTYITTAEPTAELQEIVVTGSLIKRPAAETAEAVTILKVDALKDQGIVNVEQVMNTLTSAPPTVNIASNVGSFTGGGSYANLRHLGNGSTLVLLDGQRVANNAFNGNAVDLSGIPFSAIDSVQVLREGASALYGSDAIAGVINFITKKDYQGLEVQGNFDRPQKSGG